MSVVLELKRMNIDSVKPVKVEVYDLNGATVFSIGAATWALYNRIGTEVLSGIGAVNNADTDAAGNTIKTVTATIDLNATDLEIVGVYYLVFDIALTSGQTGMCRIPIELVDVRTPKIRSIR